MTPEGIVVAAVEEYFSQSKFQKFSIKKEDRIQFGSRSGFADIVLIDSKNNRAVIVECKRDGVEGDGIEQLKSYLSATDTPLGIFANSIKPDSWNFYENLGKNQFREISTRSEFEKRVVKRVNNFLTRVSDFFTRFSRPKRNESEPIKSIPRPVPIEPSEEYIESSPVPSLEPDVDYMIGDESLQNKYRENTIEPSLNGKPYYSEDNGFSCAAALRGMPAALPEHIGIIIRNEHLEIETSREQIQSQINQLDEEKNNLELQKHDHEQQIRTITQELGEKRTKRTELKAELKTPTNTELNQLSEIDRSTEPETLTDDKLNQLPEGVPSTELETSTTAELDRLPEIARPLENSTKIYLKEKIRELEQEIREKTQEHTEKRDKLARLKVELEAPTKAELDLADTEVPAKQRFSWRQLITASIATIFLVPLAVYLFIFYASVVDKAFFLDVASLKGKSQDALNAIDIVNPTALSEAFQRPGNPVVILFPSIFLAFAIVAHHFWEQRKWILLGAILLFTLLFDGILAIQISQKIHEVKKIAGLIPDSENWVFRTNDLNMWTVIFSGFIVSLLVSILYHAAVELWKGVRPLKDESKQLEIKIRAEKNSHMVQSATLKAEVKKFEKDLDQLNNKYTIYQQNLDKLFNQQLETQIKAEKHPIEVKIAVLKTEMQNLQDEIDLLNEQVKNTEQEIAERQTQIEALLERQRTKVIDLRKMDSQVSQFVSGWCKYVAQSEIDLAEVPEKIESIRQIKQETLESYFKNLRSYSSRVQENFSVEDRS